MLRTGCFCIGPGIDSWSGVLALGSTGLGANTANLESIPGPIQKQPVRNTMICFALNERFPHMAFQSFVYD